MKVEIIVPAMGESVTEAIVSSIIKPSGSSVQREDEIIELETDKVNQVLYASDAGKLTLHVNLDDVVTVGQVIGEIDTSAAVEAAPEEPKAEAPPPVTPGEVPARKKEEAFISELKEKPAPAPAPAKAAVPEPKEGEVRTRMSGLRRTIAEKLVEAKNQTAMLTTFNEIDMTSVIEVRNREKENFEKRYGVRLGFMSFFIKAVVAALKEIPQINSYIDSDEIVTLSTYDIGIAVSTEKGLMVPVIRGCDQLSYAEIEAKIKDFAKRARERKITVDDLRGGSFTITNGGVFGSLISTPLINFPQSAILGMHAIVKRPIAKEDQIEVRPMMYVALSYDHRLIDGKEAILFLGNLKENLEDPTRLLLEL